MWIVRVVLAFLGVATVKSQGAPMPKVKRPRNEGFNINPLIDAVRSPLPARPPKAPPPAPNKCCH